ncbi:helix-turn-helix transcriptional regulator [Soonwooa sp.]|uniref:helix-turn-helix domain-containing protein n=1 Tax=Soonwooa sp. TaxID=1938592 RepID=UPI0028B19E9A|nr:helix-turn-helix transcriptional regulator [Soonwooa sp.]
MLFLRKKQMIKFITKKIKFLRKLKNYSQVDMAEKLNISQSAYARMERGESNSWALYIMKLSEVLDVEPEELIFDNNNVKSDFSETLSKKLIEQYEARISNLEEQLKYWKTKT